MFKGAICAFISGFRRRVVCYFFQKIFFLKRHDG